MLRKAGACAAEGRTDGEQAWGCSPGLVVSSPDTGPHWSTPSLNASPGRLGLHPRTPASPPPWRCPSHSYLLPQEEPQARCGWDLSSKPASSAAPHRRQLRVDLECSLGALSSRGLAGDSLLGPSRGGLPRTPEAETCALPARPRPRARLLAQLAPSGRAAGVGFMGDPPAVPPPAGASEPGDRRQLGGPARPRRASFASTTAQGRPGPS